MKNAYPGTELGVFKDAVNWKRYWSHRLAPYVRGQVLEVGAGMGGTRGLFSSNQIKHWHALEPDADLASHIRASQDLEVTVGTTAVISGSFDTLLYIDVLEHIEADAEELQRAASLLNPGGHLVTLSPAHQWLYSDFDKAIGHHRRYNRETITAISPAGTTLVGIEYLDSVGVLASLGSRLMRSEPTPRRVRFWDRLMVPVSRLTDVLTLHKLGKSIIAIWRKDPTSS